MYLYQSVYLLGLKVTQHDGRTGRPGSDLSSVLVVIRSLYEELLIRHYLQPTREPQKLTEIYISAVPSHDVKPQYLQKRSIGTHVYSYQLN